MYRTWQNNRDQDDPPTKNNQKEGKVFMRQMILRILDIKRQRTVILRQETNKVSVTADYWKPRGFPDCDTASGHGGAELRRWNWACGESRHGGFSGQSTEKRAAWRKTSRDNGRFPSSSRQSTGWLICVWKLSEARERKNHLRRPQGSVYSAYNKLEIAPVPNRQNGKLHIHGA